jgi:hypothetical protein
MHTSRCTRLSREYPRMYAVIREKAAYINIIMFFGDDQGNIKRYKVVQRG